MPNAMPRKIRSTASVQTAKGIAPRSFIRHATGKTFPDRLMASIVGNVPKPNRIMKKTPAKKLPCATAPANAT